MPLGATTFLFADVECSTGVWGQQLAAVRTTLERDDDILRTAVAGHPRLVFPTGADRSAAVFQRSVDAVEAVDAQPALQSKGWHAPILLTAGNGDSHRRGAGIRRQMLWGAATSGGWVHGRRSGRPEFVSSATAGELDLVAELERVDLGLNRLKGLEVAIRIFAPQGVDLVRRDTPFLQLAK
jgi:hypothetical protein